MLSTCTIANCFKTQRLPNNHRQHLISERTFDLGERRTKRSARVRVFLSMVSTCKPPCPKSHFIGPLYSAVDYLTRLLKVGTQRHGSNAIDHLTASLLLQSMPNIRRADWALGCTLIGKEVCLPTGLRYTITVPNLSNFGHSEAPLDRGADTTGVEHG